MVFTFVVSSLNITAYLISSLNQTPIKNIIKNNKLVLSWIWFK